MVVTLMTGNRVDEYSFANFVKRLGVACLGMLALPLILGLRWLTLLLQTESGGIRTSEDQRESEAPIVLDGRVATEVVRPTVKNLFAKKA